MTDCTKLRAAISGLVGLAAEEEAILLDEAGPGTTAGDGPWRWAAIQGTPSMVVPGHEVTMRPALPRPGRLGSRCLRYTAGTAHR